MQPGARICEHCSTLLQRHADEREPRYRLRRFCGNRCSRLSRETPGRLGDARRCIVEFHREHGRVPTPKEIAFAMNLKSRTHAEYFVASLVSAGVLKRQPRIVLNETRAS